MTTGTSGTIGTSGDTPTPGTTRTSVIGGGAAGLATAILLAREGHTVDLFEKNDHLGGRIDVFERDEFRFDTGPSWYLMPEVFDHFFALAGTTAEAELDLRTLDPGYTVFSRAGAVGPADAPTGPVRSLTIPHGPARVLAAFDRTERGAGDVLDDYLQSAKRTKELAVAHFLYNPFTSAASVLDREILGSLPTLMRMLGTSLETHANSAVRDPMLRQILQYPAIFLGTDPRRAPAIYHLMSTLDLDEGVRYPMGGFSTIVDSLVRLARQAGVRIHTGADVTRIRAEAVPQSARTTSARGAKVRGMRARDMKAHGRTVHNATKNRRVTGVTWVDDAGVEREHSAEIVVSAADLHHTETRLLDPVDRSRPEGSWQKVTSGPGAVLIFLGIAGELPQLPHHSLFFTEDWTANFDAIFGPRPRIPSPASIYVCRPSATDPTVAPPGHENLFVLIPIPADAGIGAGGPDGTGDPRIEAAADRAIDQIAAWAEIPDLRQRIRVRQTQGPTDFAERYHSWLGGMLGPAHTLDQSAMFRAKNASTKLDGLYYAGATTSPGVGVPMCLISAEIVLKRIRGDASPGPLPVT